MLRGCFYIVAGVATLVIGILAWRMAVNWADVSAAAPSDAGGWRQFGSTLVSSLRDMTVGALEWVFQTALPRIVFGNN